MHMTLPPGAPVMEVPEHQLFLMASPLSQPMPVFPAGVSRKAAQTSVCVEMVVDESGAVSSAVPIHAPECTQPPPAGIDPRFVATVVEAVGEWQFLAAAVCTFPPGTARNEDCSGPDVVVSPVAIRLSYVFSFDSGGRVTGLSRAAR